MGIIPVIPYKGYYTIRESGSSLKAAPEKGVADRPISAMPPLSQGFDPPLLSLAVELLR